ncbi:hypothetical protein ACFZBP_38115 [Streptomyces sp. NPDC008086]|uniref:hypothetical protein n=1 Tax=Streptomyces sp. NPDC008086 TaxID=3364807 RepID=UPI0036ED0F61
MTGIRRGRLRWWDRRHPPRFKLGVTHFGRCDGAPLVLLLGAAWEWWPSVGIEYVAFAVNVVLLFA